MPKQSERDRELARNIVSDVGHSTYEQADGCVERAAAAIAQARAEEREALRDKIDEITASLPPYLEDYDEGRRWTCERLRDFIEARGKEGE